MRRARVVEIMTTTCKYKDYDIMIDLPRNTSRGIVVTNIPRVAI